MHDRCGGVILCEVLVKFPKDHWTLKTGVILRTQTTLLSYTGSNPSIGGSKILRVSKFFKWWFFPKILCQDVVIFAALFEDDAQIIYFENDWKEEDRPRHVKCRNPWCFETHKFRRSEKLRWCVRLQDWRWTVRLQTFGTEKFQLIGFFWMDQTPPPKIPSRKPLLRRATRCSFIRTRMLRCTSCKLCSDWNLCQFIFAESQVWIWIFLMLLLFAWQGKQNWRLSSNFFFSKVRWVQCLHLKPFHMVRWMLTTAWPSCKSMSLGGFLETGNCCSS